MENDDCELVTPQEFINGLFDKKIAELEEITKKIYKELHETKRSVRNLQEKNKDLQRNYTALSNHFDMFILLILVYCVFNILRLFMY